VAVALEAVGLVPLFSREGFAPPKAPARFRCTCGREHESAASDAYYGKVRSCGCRSSHVEAQLWDAIKEFAPDAIKNSRKVIAPRELDVWIPSAKLGIELDGLYWHGERFKGPEVRTDMLRKLMAVETLGARCLFFFEDEWELRQTAILGYVRSLTGTKKSIGARECKIVDGLECQEFIEKYHLQGGDGHCLTGLTLDGELVAAASFSKALPSSGVVGNVVTWAPASGYGISMPVTADAATSACSSAEFVPPY
jgi:very-short-patch-repair endonuclease